ncbi:hypothetical protein F2Q68_00039131 [Brassica cretica]|uniref:Uncharacterized protein n=1 Tax=Brassica cretica TaxID=69181 RepID=A0A8S9M8W6_BRACR|nr:hypothetical protein F2Q68_00039131 [Brassica cretica]
MIEAKCQRMSGMGSLWRHPSCNCNDFGCVVYATATRDDVGRWSDAEQVDGVEKVGEASFWECKGNYIRFSPLRLPTNGFPLGLSPGCYSYSPLNENLSLNSVMRHVSIIYSQTSLGGCPLAEPQMPICPHGARLFPNVRTPSTTFPLTLLPCGLRLIHAY